MLSFFYIIGASIAMTLFLGSFNLDTITILSGTMAFNTLMCVLLDINEKLGKNSENKLL